MSMKINLLIILKVPREVNELNKLTGVDVTGLNDATAALLFSGCGCCAAGVPTLCTGLPAAAAATMTLLSPAEASEKPLILLIESWSTKLLGLAKLPLRANNCRSEELKQKKLTVRQSNRGCGFKDGGRVQKKSLKLHKDSFK